MNLEKVIFAFTIILASVATILKFGGRSHMGAGLLAKGADSRTRGDMAG